MVASSLAVGGLAGGLDDSLVKALKRLTTASCRSSISRLWRCSDTSASRSALGVEEVSGGKCASVLAGNPLAEALFGVVLHCLLALGGASLRSSGRRCCRRRRSSGPLKGASSRSREHDADIIYLLGYPTHSIDNRCVIRHSGDLLGRPRPRSQAYRGALLTWAPPLPLLSKTFFDQAVAIGPDGIPGF